MPILASHFRPRQTTSASVLQAKAGMLVVRLYAADPKTAHTLTSWALDLLTAVQYSNLPVDRVLFLVWMGHKDNPVKADSSPLLAQLLRKEIAVENLPIKTEVSEMFGVFDQGGQLLNYAALYAAQRGRDFMFSISPAMVDYMNQGLVEQFVSGIAQGYLALGAVSAHTQDMKGWCLTNDCSYYNLQTLAGARLFQVQLPGQNTYKGAHPDTPDVLHRLVQQHSESVLPVLGQIDLTGESDLYRRLGGETPGGIQGEFVEKSRMERYMSTLPKKGKAVLEEALTVIA